MSRGCPPVGVGLTLGWQGDTLTPRGGEKGVGPTPCQGWGPHYCMDSGSVLLSHTIPRAVPSALEGLTTGFGMGPGVTLPLWPPENLWGIHAWMLVTRHDP